MNRGARICVAALCVWLANCGGDAARTEIVLQRFFGACRAEVGDTVDVSAVEGECQILTAIVNRFHAENPDILVRVRTVAWPGYNQLSAQMAAGDAPDLVSMHMSAIPDFESRHLIEPMGPMLLRAGLDPEKFTLAGRRGVTRGDQIFGLAFDTWAPLWHINLNYFRQAGLVAGDRPILPRSPEELLDHARRFKAATGKPYFVQAMVNEHSMNARNLYTYLMQQGVSPFEDSHHIKLRTPEARRVVQMFKQMYDERLTTRDQDYAAATSGFVNGDGGVYLAGTWLISQFDTESHRADRPLSNGYAVVIYPQLFDRDASFVDGHSWVMPVKSRTPLQSAALQRLIRFLADHDFDWSRVGHLPAIRSVVESPVFASLPHRDELARLTRIGMPLSSDIQRQFAIQNIVSDEIGAAIQDQKPVDAALADAEERVNDLLFHLL